MVRLYGDSYKAYMQRTGMFFPRFQGNGSNVPMSAGVFHPRNILALMVVVIFVIGTGFVCRFVTLNSLQLASEGNITLVSIMPEDSRKEPVILNAIASGGLEFLDTGRDYLGYEMPVDYIMQGMIANTGAEHHLYKQHHTVGLIIDWVLHPFAHLRRSPSAQMAKMHHVDPAMARRHHCPLGIDDPKMDCDHCKYRRVVFVEVDNPSNKHLTGKALFAFNTKRRPVGFIDIDTETREIIYERRVGSKTAWSDVPTPGI